MPQFVRATFHRSQLTAEFVAANGDRLLRTGGAIPWRFNNPGNLRPPRKRQVTTHIGVGETATGQFLIFPSYDVGRQELKRLLREVYNERSIEETITKFAPPSENDTGKYIDLVCARAQVERKAVLNSLSATKLEAVIDAIEHIEGYHHKKDTRVEKWIRTTTVALSDGARPLGHQQVIVRQGNSERIERTNRFGELRPFVHSTGAVEAVELFIDDAKSGLQRVGQLVLSGPSRAMTFFRGLLEVDASTRPHAGANKSRQAPPPIRYRVQPGDTLGKIARKFKTTPIRIQENNKLVIKDPNKIHPEMILWIHGSSSDRTPSNSEARGASVRNTPLLSGKQSRGRTVPARSQQGQGRPIAMLPSEQKRAPWMEVAVREAKQWAGFRESEAKLKKKGGKGVIADNYHELVGVVIDRATPTLSTAWCASFVNYCLKDSGYPYTRDPSSQFPTRSSKFVKIASPIYGAIVVYKHTNRQFGNGHVAFVYARLEGGDLAVLGGNQGESITLNTHRGVYLDQLKCNLVGFYVPATYLAYANRVLKTGDDLGTPRKLQELKDALGDASGLETKTT